MFELNVNQIKKFCTLLLILATLFSCQKDDKLSTTTTGSDSYGNDQDIMVFASEADYEAFVADFIELRDPYQWKNVYNPNVRTLW